MIKTKLITEISNFNRKDIFKATKFMINFIMAEEGDMLLLFKKRYSIVDTFEQSRNFSFYLSDTYRDKDWIDIESDFFLTLPKKQFRVFLVEEFLFGKIKIKSNIIIKANVIISKHSFLTKKDKRWSLT